MSPVLEFGPEMTASKIIEEIKRLDPKEQLDAIRFAYQLDAERRLMGKELSSLAERMVKATDPTKEARIRESIGRGFYGQREKCLRFGGEITRRRCSIIYWIESRGARFLRITLARRLARHRSGGSGRQMVQTFFGNDCLW